MYKFEGLVIRAQALQQKDQDTENQESKQVVQFGWFYSHTLFSCDIGYAAVIWESSTINEISGLKCARNVYYSGLQEFYSRNSFSVREIDQKS